MMRNILFILDYYMTNASPNGVCCENIIKKMKQNGYHVFVCAFNHDDKEPIEEVVDGVRIFRKIHTLRKEKRSKVFTKLKIYAKWLNPFLETPPYIDKKKVKEILMCARDIINSNKIDTVVCVHLPAESLVAGKQLKKDYPSIKFVSYMLDSFSGGFIPRFLIPEYCRRKKVNWEESLLSPFDISILMESSRKHHLKYSKKMKWYSKALFLDIPLLTESDITKSEKRDDDKIKVAFCGLLNVPARNVFRFIELIKLVKSENIEFVWAGNSNVKEQIENNKPSNLTYYGYVQHTKVKEILSESNMCLNLGVKVPSAISGKIFEYMSYGKPIISTFSIDEEACIPYLEKYPCALLLDERVCDLKLQAEMLEEFILKNKERVIERKQLEVTYYNNTPDAFIEAISNKLKELEIQ